MEACCTDLNHSSLHDQSFPTRLKVFCPFFLAPSPVLRALSLVLDRLERGVCLACRGDWWVVNNFPGLDWRPLVSVTLISIVRGVPESLEHTA